jgi:hypothetical protein
VRRDNVRAVASEATARNAYRRAMTRLPPTTLAWVALGVLLLAAGGFLLYETRGTTFWGDEWTWILDRRGNDVDTFLKPHNEHLSLIPVAIYKLMFATVGLEHYGPYRAMVIVAHLGAAALVFVYASRRVGSVLALCATALVLFLGPGWQNLLWPFQIGWLISLAAGVCALLALDRADRRGDVTACVLIAVALASSGLGVAIAIGVVVELALGRRRWRDMWVVAVPLGPYAIWWLAYRPAGLLKGNIDQAFQFAAESAAGTLGALAGLAGSGVPEGVDALQWGRPLAVLAVVGLLLMLARYAQIPPRVLGLLAIMVAFWVLTGLRRAMLQEPDASRYLYVGALFVVLLVVELARGVSLTRRVALLIVVVAGAAVLSNAGTVRDGGRYLRDRAGVARANLAALELSRDDVGPRYIARGFPGYPFIYLLAGRYFEAADDWGTPAFSPAELASAPEDARMNADGELVRIHRIGLRASSSRPPLGTPPEVTSVASGRVSEQGRCLAFRPAGVRAQRTAPGLEVTIPRAGIAVRADGSRTTVGVRRFAVGFSEPLRDAIARSEWATLQIPADGAPQPWRARITAQERVSVCGLR